MVIVWRQRGCFFINFYQNFYRISSKKSIKSFCFCQICPMICSRMHDKYSTRISTIFWNTSAGIHSEISLGIQTKCIFKFLSELLNFSSRNFQKHKLRNLCRFFLRNFHGFILELFQNIWGISNSKIHEKMLWMSCWSNFLNVTWTISQKKTLAKVLTEDFLEKIRESL